MGTIDIIVKRIHFGEDGVWKELKEEEMTILETETVGSLHSIGNIVDNLFHTCLLIFIII